MIGEKKERWRELCEKAAVEQDPEKLLALTQEIDALLAEKYDRIGPRHKPDDKPSSN